MVDEFTFWRRCRTSSMSPADTRQAWFDYQLFMLKEEIDAKKAQVEEAILRHVQATQDALGEPVESKGTG